jgi:hypothetical protein
MFDFGFFFFKDAYLDFSVVTNITKVFLFSKTTVVDRPQISITHENIFLGHYHINISRLLYSHRTVRCKTAKELFYYR